MIDGRTDFEFNRPMDQDAQRKLIVFLYQKQRCGKISESDVQNIMRAGAAPVYQSGAFNDPMTVTSPEELAVNQAVMRHGFHLMQMKLLELHPDLELELSNYNSQGQGR